jgi:hypothetical protein
LQRFTPFQAVDGANSSRLVFKLSGPYTTTNGSLRSRFLRLYGLPNSALSVSDVVVRGGTPYASTGPEYIGSTTELRSHAGGARIAGLEHGATIAAGTRRLIRVESLRLVSFGSPTYGATVRSVELYDRDQRVASFTAPPYEYDLLATDGGQLLRAKIVWSNGEFAWSNPVAVRVATDSLPKLLGNAGGYAATIGASGVPLHVVLNGTWDQSLGGSLSYMAECLPACSTAQWVDINTVAGTVFTALANLPSSATELRLRHTTVSVQPLHLDAAN